jgi:hypothetical protein
MTCPFFRYALDREFLTHSGQQYRPDNTPLAKPSLPNSILRDRLGWQLSERRRDRFDSYQAHHLYSPAPSTTCSR